MIDVKNYVEKKEKGLVSVAKLGNDFAISVKKFSPETGEELDPDVEGFKFKQLEKIKSGLQEAIASIDSLIADVSAL